MMRFSSLFIMLAVVLVALACTLAPTVEAFLSLDFDIFTALKNRTTPFGADGGWDTSSSLRLDPAFRFAAVALVNMPAPFTAEAFKQRVLSALPAKWKNLPSAYRQFDANFMLLEACTWPEYKPSCDEMRKTLSDSRAWTWFAATRFDKPVCRDENYFTVYKFVAENVGASFTPWSMLPLLTQGDSANWTLVRFTFAGADRVQYLESLLLEEHDQQAKLLGLCDLGATTAPVSGQVQEMYGMYVDAANPFERTVAPAGTPLPTKIQDALSKLKRFIKVEPGTSVTIAAVIIIMVLMCVICCTVKVIMAKRNIDELKRKFDASQAAERATAGGDANGRAATYSPRSGDDDRAGSNLGGDGGGVRRRAERPSDEFGDAVDEMAEKIRRMAARRREQEAAASSHQGFPAAAAASTSAVDGTMHNDRLGGHGRGTFAAEHELEKVAPSPLHGDDSDDDDDDKRGGGGGGIVGLFSPSSNAPQMLAPPPTRDDGDYH